MSGCRTCDLHVIERAHKCSLVRWARPFRARANALFTAGCVFSIASNSARSISGFNTSVRLNFDYAVTDRDTLYLGGDYRRGDVVSSGRASLENIDTAKVLVPDDAFPGGDWFSYRLEANTLVTTLGFNHGFGPKASIDASWRHAVSKPMLSPSFPTSVPNRYVTDQFSVSLVLRF